MKIRHSDIPDIEVVVINSLYGGMVSMVTADIRYDAHDFAYYKEHDYDMICVKKQEVIEGLFNGKYYIE
jgi:hypothetical protein